MAFCGLVIMMRSLSYELCDGYGSDSRCESEIAVKDQLSRKSLTRNRTSSGLSKRLCIQLSLSGWRGIYDGLDERACGVNNTSD